MKNIISTAFALFLIVFLTATQTRAAQTDISGPTGSREFGSSVTVLPNGNIVVTDPYYSIPNGAANVGAVYLYDGATLALISTLTGSTAGDRVGTSGIITVLTNGNYVVRSPNWDNGAIADAGAVTFCNSTIGVSGVVSASNSLVGSTANDQVGGGGITTLTNGNYVVNSFNWNNGAATSAGAATFGNGTTGVSGVVSASNSLVGSSANDQVGDYGITALNNGNYVVNSINWDNGAATNAGAATFGNGTTGVSGVVSTSNSLVGSKANDQVGNRGIIALTNGNYVVSSPNWDNGAISDAGAVTFGNGTRGISGIVSASNSLVGSTAGDRIGDTITALNNGNYVVSSTSWDNGSIADVGAATFGNGISGITGAVSASNSLVGSSANDNVGIGITALTNGNYVVSSGNWDNGSLANAGAATFGSGTTGISGAVSVSNSLVGSKANDNVSIGITVLTNGNYVVSSPNWDNDAIVDAGAATFGNGTTGVSGVVSASNSLVGSKANDKVGNIGITALTNGNYVVSSPNWDNDAIVDAGAATFGNGTTGTSGTVSVSNSFIGSTVGDNVGNNVVGRGITPLVNGNYVVGSPNWDNGAIADAGAATFGNGTTGTSGFVSASNSLVGSKANDQVGSYIAGGSIVALTNGNYIVRSRFWDNGAIADAGAVTFGNGISGISGAVSASNSLVGSSASDNIGTEGSDFGIVALTNGNYVVVSPAWDNGFQPDAGAVTFGNGTSGTVGAITSGATGGNSVVGTVGTIGGSANRSAFDATRNRLVVGRGLSNTVSILSFTTTATSDGDLSSAANFNNGAPNALVSAIIPTGRMMTLSTKLNIGQVRVQCGGNLTGGSSAAYIIGSVRRDFCGAANESFVYPLGDANNYTPLTVSSANGTGALTASVTDTFMNGLPQAKSLSRYWSLTGAGITAALTFKYVDADINGTETTYKAFKRNSANLTVPVTSLLDTATNTFTVTGVSQFSDWSAGDASFAPTAAGVSISGRVALPGNRNLSGATVSLTTADGATVQTDVSWKGEYQFDGIAAGQTVTITVFAKRYQFAPQTINVTEDLTDVNFAPLP